MNVSLQINAKAKTYTDKASVLAAKRSKEIEAWKSLNKISIIQLIVLLLSFSNINKAPIHVILRSHSQYKPYLNIPVGYPKFVGESFLVPQFWIITSVTCTVLRMNSIMVALCFLVVHIKYLCILVGVPMFTITQLCYTKLLFEKVLFYGNWLQLSLNSSPSKSYTRF